MAMPEQERRSPLLETAGTASDEPQLPGLVPITGRSAATMAGGDGAGEEERGPEAGCGAADEEEWGAEGSPDNVRSSSPWVALLSVISSQTSHVAISPEFQPRSPFEEFQRKPRSHVPRAALSRPWGFKFPVLPPAPAKKARKRTAKKRDKLCTACGKTETPLWRTWPTDRRIMLCNACGIRARAPGAVLPELLYLHPPATMLTGAMAGGGGAGKEERGTEGALDNVRSSSRRAALPSVVSFRSLLIANPEFQRKSPFKKFQRKPRSHVPRTVPSHPWGFKLPVLPPAPAKKARKRTAKKRDKPCAACGKTETPLWRTWPTDRRIMLCSACGIRARAPGAVLPELLYLRPPATVVSELEQPAPHEIQPVSNSPEAMLPEQAHLPPPATATTTVVSVVEQLEIQDSESPPDSPILDSMLNFDVYLLKRTSPRRERSPGVESAPAAAAPAPGNENGKREKCCLHCGSTSSLQWRTGPMGASTLCNLCGVRHRQGRLVPEYRPRASPTFNQAEHSYKHREVLKIRRMQDHPAPPAPFQPSRTWKRRKDKGQQQPSQVSKKRKGNKEQNQPAQAQPAAVAVLQGRKKSKAKATQRLPPEPALLKLRKVHKGKEQQRRPPHPAAAQHLPPPPPPPPALLPHLSPPPPPAQPHAGYEMLPYLPPPTTALPHAADDMEMEQHLLPLPPALPHAGDDNDMEQPHAGDELVMGEPIPPPEPFLFDGPAAPRIIDDDKPVTVIVIDDD